MGEARCEEVEHVHQFVRAQGASGTRARHATIRTSRYVIDSTYASSRYTASDEGEPLADTTACGTAVGALHGGSPWVCIACALLWGRRSCPAGARSKQRRDARDPATSTLEVLLRPRGATITHARWWCRPLAPTAPGCGPRRQPRWLAPHGSAVPRCSDPPREHPLCRRGALRGWASVGCCQAVFAL